MTRVIGKQVNDPRSEYSKIRLTVASGVGSVSIPGNTLHQQTVTIVPGGCEEDLPPQITGLTAEPYLMSAGEQISISIDDGLPTLVTFTALDTTAGAVVKKINNAHGADISRVVNGAVQFVSNGTVGPTGSVKLIDTFGAPLAKLGIPAGTYNGFGVGTRGVITFSGSGLGGYVPVRLTGRQNLVSETDALIQSSGNSGGVTYVSTVTGGNPINGRLTYSGGNYILSFYTQLPSKAFVTTKGADFAALDGTDSLSVLIVYNDLTVNNTVTFPSPPYTRDTVIDRINTVWAQTAFSTNGRVVVKGRISQPYDFSNETVYVTVYGGSQQALLFNSSDKTAQDVADKFNTVSGVSATVITTSNGKYVQLTTSGGVGLTSAITVEDADSNNQNALTKMGITSGKYTGPYIAYKSGVGDIIITSHNRGTKSNISIGGSTQTKDRMGLTGIIGGQASENEIDVPVTLPDLDTFGKIKSTYVIEAMIPEVVSFGEVRSESLSLAEKFDQYSTGSNIDTRRDIAVTTDNIKYPDGYKSSVKNSGKVVNTNPDGLIDPGQLGHATALQMKYMKQFIEGNFNTGDVSGLITNRISTTGFNNNPNNSSPSITFQIDPIEDFTAPNRKLDITFGTVSTPGYSWGENLGVVQKGLNIGANFATDIALSLVNPRVVYPLANNDDRQLISETYDGSGTRGNVRVYNRVQSLGRAGIEVVSNARWNGTIWTKDVTGAPSSKYECTGDADGVNFRTFSSAVPTFDDSNWVSNFLFPSAPLIGSENMFGDMLRIGANLVENNSSTDTTTPRLIIPRNDGRARTLLLESPPDTDLKPTLRIYACHGSNHLGNGPNEVGMEVTHNARWREDQTPNVWQPDMDDVMASKFFIGDSGFHMKNTGGDPPATFLDDDSLNGWKSGNASSSYLKPASAFRWKAQVASPRIDMDFPGPIHLNSNNFGGIAYEHDVLYGNFIPRVIGRVTITAGVISNAAGHGIVTPTVFSYGLTYPFLSSPDNVNQIVSSLSLIGPTNYTNLQARMNFSSTDFSISFYNPANGFTVALSAIETTCHFLIWYPKT